MKNNTLPFRVFPLIGVCAVVVIPVIMYTPGVRFSDDTQYLTGVWRLAEFGDLCIPRHDMLEKGVIGSFFIPGAWNCYYSINPIGTALILFPFYCFAGFHGVLSANIVLGGIAVALGYVWFRRMYPPIVSFIGILILGSSPIIQFYMVSSMSHMAALCIQCTVLILSTHPKRSNASSAYLAASFISGLGIMVRFDLGLLIIPIICSILLYPSPAEVSLFRIRCRHVLHACLVFTLGTSFQLLYQYFCLGSVLKSGYQQHQQISNLLQWEMIGRAFPRALTAISHEGMGIFAIIGLAGWIRLSFSERRRAAVFLSIMLPTFFLYLLFHPFSSRYFIPVFPVLAICAADGLSRIPGRAIKAAAILLVMTTCLISNDLQSYKMLTGRNGTVADQMSAIAIVRRDVPLDSVVFTPVSLGLLIELAQDRYDVRDSIMLLGPHADRFEQDPIDQHRNTMRLQSAQKRTMRAMNATLLPKLLGARGEVYAVLRIDQHLELPRRYPIEIELLGTTGGGTERYYIDRIRPIDSLIE